MNVRRILLTAVAVITLAALPLRGAELAKADLRILGTGLEVERAVTTPVDVPVAIQTTFAGKTNEEAPAAEGLSVLGELTGPGITTPLTLITRPGQRFALPALHEQGEYSLQNIRLVNDKGEFLQQALPSFSLITVVEALRPTIRVRQLSAEELRQRGISVDERNFDVYEYTFVFGVEQKFIEVPYPVMIDRRTHEMTRVPAVEPYGLPPLQVEKPPRFTPPIVMAGALDRGDRGPELPKPEKDGDKGRPARPSIPMALVVPNGFGVLHQFFAVVVQVSNGAPEGSAITLDSVRATMDAPLTMRITKSEPAVTIGAAVPVHDEKTGATFLVAGASGSSEWTVEALKAGTHTLTVDVRATYKQTGQQDFPLSGKVSTSIVVSDPRFHINFSHPDNVRADEEYTAYAFITNLGNQRQHVQLDTSFVPLCEGGWSLDNICRTAGDGKTALDFEPGQMITVPYKLKSRITGHVYAAAGTADDEALGVSVRLNMGVSASGIPLSPATLVMPYYAKFLDKSFVDANMQILGLGYSLATAPLNKFTAKFPRLITSDVFRRAQDIARAGQRVFIQRQSLSGTASADENRDAMVHLSLDLLGNNERVDQMTISPELEEWEQFRRMETSGRVSAAAMARQLEANGLTGKTPQQFADDFAAATSHRSPFLFAYVHSAGSAPQLALKGVTTSGEVRGAAEAASGWVRTLGWGELTKLDAGNDAGSEKGQLALVGRWKENVVLTIVPSTNAFTVHLIYPDTADGTQLRTDFEISGATAGAPVVITIVRGSRALTIAGATASPVVNVVPQTALRVLGAAQDLNLDKGGHVVTLLTNRPVNGGAAATLRDKISLTTDVAQINYSVTRSNKPNGALEVPGASVQEDGRILSLSFDKTLSTNATYKIGVTGLTDRLATTPFSATGVVPRIDNNAPGALLYGRVLAGDRSAVVGVPVRLTSTDVQIRQWDVTIAGGRFLFEFVPRDIDAAPPIEGRYELSVVHENKEASAAGVVRLPGVVHQVDLVFTGKGGARGHVRYDDGLPLAGAKVTVASAQYGDVHTVTTAGDGSYSVTGVSVGPMTFAVADADGRVTYAANAIRSAGEIVEQDLVVLRKAPPAGFGTVHVRVLRSDVTDPAKAAVSGAEVGVGTQGYTLATGFTDARGEYTFYDVPAGLVSVLAADWSLTRESAAAEIELRPDQTFHQTLTLRVRVPSDAVASIEGTVMRDDPASPDVRAKDVIVPGAIVSIRNLPGTVTADANGHYSFDDMPLSIAGRTLVVFDPATGRRGQFTIPDVLAGVNHFSVILSSAQPEGTATMRVRLFDAKGAPVSGFRVFSPGFPPEVFAARANGVYELPNARVPSNIEVVAVPGAKNGPYGSQSVSGRVRVDFHGQVGITDLRLPGEGTVVVRLENERPCSTPPCYEQAIGKLAVTYFDWSDEESQFTGVVHEQDADLATGLVTFTRVPALQDTAIQTVNHPAGHASTAVRLAYDGDAANVTLRLKSLGDVTGRIVTFDRQTPTSGATVTLTGTPVLYPPVPSNPDGTFRFAAVAAKMDLRIVAEQTQNGIYRTGYVDARTPDGGGPVSGLTIVMREQSSVEGQIVDANNAPVPLAKYWLRELAWPNRELGTKGEPYIADLNGRFVIGNVFTGPFRITAVDPNVQEERGTYEGTVAFEGDASQTSVKVRIGGAGSAAVSVTVLDPLKNFAPVPSAHVWLARGSSPFDLATTDANGVAYFNDVPADAAVYRVTAYSKFDGRASSSSTFTLLPNEVKAITATLDFLGFVSGRITDDEATPAGAPARGIPVTLTSQHTQTQTRASADGDGKFEFRGVPEGPFRVIGFDETSGREARSPEGLFISSLVQEHRDLALKLEATATLTLRVHLPNDAGGPGVLAPLVEATIVQADSRSLGYAHEPLAVDRSFYFRGAQGSEFQFPKMLTGYPYKIWIKELGGEQRTLVIGGSFAANQLAKTETAVLQSHGTVVVVVRDGAGQPVTDARVMVNGKLLFTPADGTLTVPGVPLGNVGVQASKGSVGASASGTLQSRTIPLTLTLSLGNTIAIKGSVEAETGGVSAGTRVVLNINSSLLASAEGGKRHLEVLTGEDGQYEFVGVPVGNTTLDFLYYGPDDTTIGAAKRVVVPDSTTGTLNVERVKLDATPPRILSIEPPANATSVSPNAPIVITFSEPIADAFRTSQWFQLIATDNGAAVTGATLTGSLNTDGTFRLRITPPASTNPAQKFPLKSNVLYRIVVPAGVQDLTGNPMKLTVGSSFTTVNYTEPAVVKVEPSDSAALAAGSTFRVKFNKPIDITSLQPGGAGAITLQQLDSFKGNVLRAVPLSVQANPADATSLTAGMVGEAVAESSFYRLTISGARDQQTPPNIQKDAKVVDYFSFDTKAPVVTIVSPVAAGEKLIAGVSYTATVTAVDEGTATPSKDIALVDWFDAAGRLLTRSTTAPFGYTFVAPATQSGTTFTLKASATDLSQRTSPTQGSFTWDVAPNNAPSDIVITSTPAGAYPTASVDTTVAFKDEGLAVTVTARLKGTAVDGSAYDAILGAKQVTRASTAVEFAPATFNWTVPVTLKDGTATIAVTAVDAVSNSGSATASFEVLADTAAPELFSLLPAETRYRFGQSYVVELRARDTQSGLAKAVFTYDGKNIEVTNGTKDASGIVTFTTPVTVPPKNADTRVKITATAHDRRGNSAVTTADVIYERVDDASIPKASWITPLDGAALPAGQTNWLTTLRLRATDNVKVTAVRFESTALAAPVVLESPKSGTTDIYEAKVALSMAAGTSFVITARISDGDPAHDVELPITIDPVAVDINQAAQAFAISSQNVAEYRDKNVLLRGAGMKLHITVPVVLKNLMVLDGALITNPEETKLDVTITDHLFVDADSRIDVSGRGYLGAWVKRDDNVSQNDTANGRTLGGRTDVGASSASASHAGLGDADEGSTNATYGSITEPADFGAGGSGGATSAQPGGSGGGAVSLRGATTSGTLSRLVIAGAIRADGLPGNSAVAGAGAGGSVLLSGRALIFGVATRISANGGDRAAEVNRSRGAGGGRLAIKAGERIDAEDAALQLQARGGRNNNSAEGAAYIDGGAGTIFIQRPNAANGELIVSALDERFPASTHLTRGTPLTAPLTFDAITVGPRALARLDSAYTVADAASVKVDATALLLTPEQQPAVTLVSTTPAANGSAIQQTPLTATFTAASAAGITGSAYALTPGAETRGFFASATSVPSTTITLPVPATQEPGAASFTLRVTDRAGRTATADATPLVIVANTRPNITAFTIAPLQPYAAELITVNAAATDDVEVTSLTLTSSLGTVTAAAVVPDAATHGLSRTFTVKLPAGTPSGTEVTLTLTAADGFPGRAATTDTRSITVRKDSIAPVITLVQPAAAAQIGETQPFTVEATIVDAEVAVKRAYVVFDGSTVELSADPQRANVFAATLTAPSIDGIDTIPYTLTVSALDFDNNQSDAVRSISIKPVIDPNGPTVSWLCGGTGALYPNNYDATLRISAIGANASNFVQKVEFRIGSQLIAATKNGSTDEWSAPYRVTGNAGDVINVTAIATSVGSNVSTLTSTLAIVSGLEIRSGDTMEDGDLSRDNGTFIVHAGATLTIVGPHTLKDLVVLGGTVVQKHRSLAAADTLTVNRLFVACGAQFDVTALGYAVQATQPGVAGASGIASGSHIGRGGIAGGSRAGVAFGSVYAPREAGGGGHAGANGATGSAGGGAIRVVASGTVAIDGVVRANGGDVNSAGGGAGGSIAITTTGLLTGGGRLEARGGNSGGGGGAIALEYANSSGSLLGNSGAEGGSDAGFARGAAGTIYRRTPQSTFGDLLVDGRGLTAAALTELPAAGITTAAAISGGRTVTTTARWLPPFLAGSAMRVTAADGSERGTWPIASITNDASARTIAGSATILTQDAVAYDGYLVYSPSGQPVYGGNATSFFAARFDNGQWQYDSDSAFVTFTPAATDVVFATFRKNAGGITSVTKIACCEAVHGVASRDLAGGELLANSRGSANELPVIDAGEIFLRADDAGRSIILSAGPAIVTLADGATPVDVRANDTLRGVYRFDHVTLKNAHVATADLLVSTNAPQLDATSSLVTGNLAAPVVSANLISFSKGLSGPIVTGATGAAIDADGLVDVTVRNLTRLTSATAAANAGGNFSIAIEGAPGDAITVSARDRHIYPMQSADVSIGSIPADYGIASVVFDPATVMSGVSSTVTVTLLGAAGSNGAQLALTSSAPALLTAPATLFVAAGATTATFTVKPAVVMAPQTVTISASYGGVPVTGTLTIQKDTIAPTATITKPLASAVIKEASNATFDVEASVADAQSGVKSVTAMFEGQSYPMALSGSIYRAALPVPDVDGGALVAKTITVTAVDNSDNSITSAPVTVQIEPLVDPNAPTLSWSCPSSSAAILPAGYTTTLRVYAKGSSASNGITGVKIVVNDGATSSTVTATAVSGLPDHFQASYAIPAALAEGTIVTARATATTQGNNSQSAVTSFIVIRSDVPPITTSTTLAINNTTYDNKTLIVYSTTATPTELIISGDHTFARVLVLDGGRITHVPATTSAAASTNVTATGVVFVSCGGSIDVSGRGYTVNTTYPGATGPGYATSGSHMGQGGLNDAPYASTFGSVYRPSEGGGGGGRYGEGGGVVRIAADSVVNDGRIQANGISNTEAGAGGSIWITTKTISGSGLVEAKGGTGHRGGGGGAVSIEYTTASGTILSNVTASGGSASAQAGGAGTVYLKAATATHGELIVDNKGLTGALTDLPALGSGAAQPTSTGSMLVTDRAQVVPTYFAGHWVEITSSTGTPKGIWKIAPIAAANSRSVTLLPNGSETISIVEGDKWRGVYRFDTVRVSNGAAIASVDPIRATALHAAEGAGELRTAIEAANVTVGGSLSATDITATNLTVNGTLRPYRNNTAAQLRLTLSGGLTVGATGVIDATGLGYAVNATYPGATGPGYATSGSHMGQGGLNDAPYASTFGSIYRPNEAGGGGGRYGEGGGVVQITADAVVIDGRIQANGISNTEAGAGGSIRIATKTLSGSGVVEAKGGSGHRGGGGGAVAVEYTTASGTILSNISAPGGSASAQAGGAGTVYLKSATATYGELIVDNKGSTAALTDLPALGSGTAQPGSGAATLVTDRATVIPTYFAGHWVEITSATGTPKGIWKIAPTIAANSKNVTLVPNGVETISLAHGDKWRGVYLFDSVRVTNGAALASIDPIRTATLNGDAGELRTAIEAVNVTVSGTLSAAEINATNLTVSGTLRPYRSTAAAQLRLTLSGALTISATGAIDATGLGYAVNATYPGATAPGYATSGSHMGHGGLNEAPYASTFGSVYRPIEAGGGGGRYGEGGGVVRITTDTLVNDGRIQANGISNTEAGAGGSIWITANAISGSGVVEAKGGSGHRGGGGGAVAIEYTTATGTMLSNVTASGGSASAQAGGAGTVYLKAAAATYGELIIDNKGLTGALTDLPALGSGIAQATPNVSTLVTDRAQVIPSYFAGHWVEITSPAGTPKGVWKVGPPNGKTLTLLPNGSETISIVEGDKWRGVYRFDSLRIRSGNARSLDRVIVTTTPDAETLSRLQMNDGPPQFNSAVLSQIAVVSSASAVVVSGPADAVTDASTPILLTATNVRTQQTYSGTAAANGSFSFAVSGQAGDTFTLRATDSHVLPMTSPVIAVNGSLQDVNGVASLTINPSSVLAGGTSTATITLSAAARTGGVGVTLASSNSSVATIPATATVPAGSTSVNVNVTAVNVGSATLTATAAGISATAAVTVTTPVVSLASIVLSPSSVEGGLPGTGTVTLNLAAPAGGVAVALTSSSAASVQVPATVTVAAGQTAASFTIATSKVSAPASVTISGTYGDTRAAVLTLTTCSMPTGVTAPSSLPLTTAWYDDALPAGAVAAGDGTVVTAQRASGTSSLRVAGSGLHSYSFSGAAPLAVTPTDMLVVYALVNRCTPPRQISVTWRDSATSFTTSWGESLIDAITSSPLRVGAVPEGGTWVRLEVLASAAGITSARNLTALSIRTYDGEAWFDRIGVNACVLGTAAAPALPANETVWFDDALPAGAVAATPSGAMVAWTWSNAQAASGATSHPLPLQAGVHQQEFSGATETLVTRSGDTLFTYVLIDPCNPPRELMIGWNDGNGWEHRAFWGDDVIGVPSGPGNAGRYYVGPMPEAGKWVRLEVPADRVGVAEAVLSGMTFVAYDGRAWFDRAGRIRPVNLALNRPATQSTVYGDSIPTSGPANAVDGNISGDTRTNAIAMTGSEPQSWWQVDLGAVQPIDTVVLWNRTDAAPERLQNFYVLISDTQIPAGTTIAAASALPGVTAHFYGDPAPRATSFRVHRAGRYVRVQLAGTNILQLAEVQVFAPVSPTRQNYAAGRAATSSSVYANWGYAARANSGADDWSHTNGDANAWWQVDLGSVQNISAVEFTNVFGGGYSEPLRNFYVLVSDAAIAPALSTALADATVARWYHGAPHASGYSFLVNRTGRYVRIQLSAADFLHPRYVRVWSATPSLPSLLRLAPEAPSPDASLATGSQR